MLLFFFLSDPPRGPIQGRTKIGHGGLLLQETSSSDWKATATNRMHSNDIEACGQKCCYFWFHSRDFACPFLVPNFGLISNAKMTFFFKKMVQNSQSGTPKKFVIVHLEQRIHINYFMRTIIKADLKQ